jgi:uncharacterized protein YndB with AHSA1/START domain/class 3 adenylate cyclase
MDVRTERGFLMLADFSGYTSFMAKSELDHAQAIVRELLEMVSARLSSLLTLVEVEGDALYVYAPAERVHRGETLLELIESTYVAFRDKLGSMKRHTTCGCVACSSVQSLDLKFFTHFGEYVPQKIAGNFKLIGSAVNLLHRLTKNRVTEATGWKGYALFSDAALNQLSVRPKDLHTMTEQYEHLGDVVTHSVDLHKRHQELTDERRVFIAAEEADVVKQREFSCPPPVLWEWLNDPRKRNKWMEGATWTALARPSGRTGPGATNHCAHGKGASIEQIVDWRPIEYFSTEAKEGPMLIKDTVILTPKPNGTYLSHHIFIQMPLPRFLIRPITRMVVNKVMKVEQCWDRIERLIEEEDGRSARLALHKEPEPA